MAELAYRSVKDPCGRSIRHELSRGKTPSGANLTKDEELQRDRAIVATSRHVVRKWMRRYQKLGDADLRDRSRRPHHTPHQTPPEIEQRVLDAREKTHYGRQRLAIYLKRQGLHLSPYTIRHILRRHRSPQKRVRRKPLYPAHWAWEVKQPFSLFQTDVKDILDKGTLGTQRTSHLRRQGLPRSSTGHRIGFKQVGRAVRTATLPSGIVAASLQDLMIR